MSWSQIQELDYYYTQDSLKMGHLRNTKGGWYSSIVPLLCYLAFVLENGIQAVASYRKILASLLGFILNKQGEERVWKQEYRHHCSLYLYYIHTMVQSKALYYMDKRMTKLLYSVSKSWSHPIKHSIKFPYTQFQFHYMCFHYKCRALSATFLLFWI